MVSRITFFRKNVIRGWGVKDTLPFSCIEMEISVDCNVRAEWLSTEIML